MIVSKVTNPGIRSVSPKDLTILFIGAESMGSTKRTGVLIALEGMSFHRMVNES